MKKILFLFFLFIICFNCKKEQIKKNSKNTLTGTISVSGAWALYPMTIKWAEEFQKLYPSVRIDVSAGGAGKGMSDALAGITDIGMVSREIYEEEINKGAWWIAVTKDAVVPTINKKNPYLKTLKENGLTKEAFTNIWVTNKIKYWEEITEGKNKNLINIYTRSDACGAASTWAKFMGKYQEDLIGIGVYSDPGLVESVKKDILGIGYNNINYVYDANTKNIIEGVEICPIDFNGNGKIDKNEDFYKNRDDIVDAIKKDKYPSPPSRLLNFVCHGKPQKNITYEFIKWAITEGQVYVLECGYIKLSDNLLKEQLKKLK